ncbi:class II histone deacetylase [Cognatishimia sp. SS12]|uniref:class II histone deacetylase n=1 Tax=Cognatishimia sp. SS12 TaxID=2979465 RepID=UPI0023309E78|nr:class II histone deacetylase [Cognatishimia sp. SS12]MDC0738161.1 class II histone deacetylase [Cognatishimia sp. SS12]
MKTGFFWDERCFWHYGGDYALTLPVGGLVQPMVSGGLPESPESKRRFRNLLDITGLAHDLAMQSAEPADMDDLLRIHPASYLTEFKALSDGTGGELGLRAPFGAGGFEAATTSAGLAKAAVFQVAKGRLKNAYALSRPPGHHCLPDLPNGFCLLANIAIAIEAARDQGLVERVAVLDWDVHHGNGTEAIYYDREDTLTISLHQANNYPLDTGDAADRGSEDGLGSNINIPLPPGAGHASYLEAMEKIVLPALDDYRPDMIIVACGFDAAALDPLSRMMATAETFKQLTALTMEAADDLCDGRLVLVHEGGYSEAYVPFCGHAVMEQLSGSSIIAPDPMAETLHIRQPDLRFQEFVSAQIDEMAAMFKNAP